MDIPVVIAQDRKLNKGKDALNTQCAAMSAAFFMNRNCIIEPDRESPSQKDLDWQDDLFNAYKPHHTSENPFEFELWCLERWYWICKWIIENDEPGALAIDSDVLIFCNVDKVDLNTAWMAPTLFISRDLAHWLPKQIINVLETGSFRWEMKQLGGKHVSDMYVLPATGCFNSKRQIGQEETFDGNLFYKEGTYGFEGHKDVYFINGEPYWLRGRMLTKLLSIHCWGAAKQKMDLIWSQSLDSRKGKCRRLTLC